MLRPLFPGTDDTNSHNKIYPPSSLVRRIVHYMFINEVCQYIIQYKCHTINIYRTVV